MVAEVPNVSLPGSFSSFGSFRSTRSARSVPFGQLVPLVLFHRHSGHVSTTNARIVQHQSTVASTSSDISYAFTSTFTGDTLTYVELDRMNLQNAFETAYRVPQGTARKRTPETPMKVLALGLGRCGTDSLRAALEHLGYATYHGWNTTGVDGYSDAMMWSRLLLRKYASEKYNGSRKIGKEDFEPILGLTQAVTDMPCAAFARELMLAYPDAKIIINTRTDVDQWYESMEKVFCALQDSWYWWYQSWFVTEAFWVRRMCCNTL